MNSEGWSPVQAYWKNPTPENRNALRAFLEPEATKWQYTHGVADPSLIAPESFTLDQALLARPGNADIQLDLFSDYQSNVVLYPNFQEYFRTSKPPLLAVWGRGMIPSSFRRARRPISETSRRRRCTSSIQVISRLNSRAGDC